MQKPVQKNPQSQPEEEFQSLAVVRKGANWVVVRLKIRGNQVVERSEGPENVRAVALEEFKVKAANTFWGSI